MVFGACRRLYHEPGERALEPSGNQRCWRLEVVKFNLFYKLNFDSTQWNSKARFACFLVSELLKSSLKLVCESREKVIVLLPSVGLDQNTVAFRIESELRCRIIADEGVVERIGTALIETGTIQDRREVLDRRVLFDLEIKEVTQIPALIARDLLLIRLKGSSVTKPLKESQLLLLWCQKKIEDWTGVLVGGRAEKADRKLFIAIFEELLIIRT